MPDSTTNNVPAHWDDTVDILVVGSGAGALTAALRATRTPFSTYTVITPANVRWLARSADWLFERGARILISTLDFGAAWTTADLRALERGYRALAVRYRRWIRAGHDFYLAPFDGKIAAHTSSAARRESCSAGHRLPPPGMNSRSALPPSAPITAVSSPCEPGRLRRMAAPAPSPKSTHVLRSFQSTMEESFSAPITSTVS